MHALIKPTIKRLIIRKRLAPLYESLLKIALHGLGLLNSENAVLSGERHLLTILAMGWGEAPIVLDVGANEGDYASQVLSLTPGAKVHAFEPHPATFSRLRKRAKKCGFTAIHSGCGEENGTMTLHDYREGDGSSHASFYGETLTSLRGAETVVHEVPVCRLDDYITRLTLSPISLLKIDTEGHEYQVLRGLQSTLRAGLVEAVQFEFNEMNIFSKSFLRDFMDLLAGYRFYRLLPDGLLPLNPYNPISCELFGFQNILALRQNSPLEKAISHKL